MKYEENEHYYVLVLKMVNADNIECDYEVWKIAKQERFPDDNEND